MGKGPLISDADRAAFLAALRDGEPWSLAARHAGVGPGTIRRWLAHGTGPDAEEPYLAFAKEVELARAEGLAALAHDWRHSRDWKAKKEYLERVAPEHFGLKQVVVHQHVPELPRGTTPIDVVAELVERKAKELGSGD